MKNKEIREKVVAAVCDWIKEDASVAAKMTMTPSMVRALVDKVMVSIEEDKE